MPSDYGKKVVLSPRCFVCQERRMVRGFFALRFSNLFSRMIGKRNDRSQKLNWVPADGGHRCVDRAEAGDISFASAIHGHATTRGYIWKWDPSSQGSVLRNGDPFCLLGRY